MGNYALKVKRFLSEHFNLNCYVLEEYPKYLGGILLTDENNDTILFYYDQKFQKIKFELNIFKIKD